MTDMRFDDDVVIITGAARGLGASHAQQFAARGARVLINDIDAEVAEQTAQSIREAGGTAVVDTNDITSSAGAQLLVQHAIDEFGKLTVIVNNAGIINYHPFGELTDELWERMLAVTLDGTYQVTRAAWPIFLEQGYGRVVNTTSDAGFLGVGTLVHYAAAKLGVAGLTKALALEVADVDIRVNAIAPMAITRMNREAFFAGAEQQSDDWQEDLRTGRAPMGPPEAVSPTVLWLAHRTTQVNGDIFSTSSGKISRVGFVVGEGYFNPDYTPEDLRDHLDTVRSLDNYLDATNGAADELALIPPLFRPGS